MSAVRLDGRVGRQRSRTAPLKDPPTPNEELVAYLQFCILDLQEMVGRLRGCEGQSWNLVGIETLDDLRTEAAHLLLECNMTWEAINGQ